MKSNSKAIISEYFRPRLKILSIAVIGGNPQCVDSAFSQR